MPGSAAPLPALLPVSSPARRSASSPRLAEAMAVEPGQSASVALALL